MRTFLYNSVALLKSVARPVFRSMFSSTQTGPLNQNANRASEAVYSGLNELDRRIEKYLDFDGGYYVELGANDGVRFSNTYYFERNRNWRGVLIEAAPNRYLDCVRNRGGQSNAVVCAACVSFEYKAEFVKMIYCDLMSVPCGVETDIADASAHTSVGQQFLVQGERLFVFGAIARTLNSILIDASAPQMIDFMSLDVEGGELEVLKGVDHDHFRFRYLLVESRNVEKLRAYLGPLGYRLVERFDDHDYLFEDAMGKPALPTA